MPKRIIIIVGAGTIDLEKAVTLLNQMASIDASMLPPNNESIEKLNEIEAKLCLVPKKLDFSEKDFDLSPKGQRKKSEIFGWNDAHSEKTKQVLKNSRKGRKL